MSGTLRKTDHRAQENLEHKKASSFKFKTRLSTPIADLSLIKKSLLFAEISLAAYLVPDESNLAAKQIGFERGEFFDCDGSQAYWYWNETDSVVVCRGTESREWNDIRAGADAMTVLAETVGRVHRGFKQEVDDLWPCIEKELVRNDKTLWFTGHSLGGAMATICAGRCLLSHIKSEPAGLFTFGSPRVGDRQYINYTDIEHFRWVNNNDVVTRIPPTWLGYRHGGREMYLDRNGALRQIDGWRRISDGLQGFLKELVDRFRIDSLSDHAIVDYINRIHDLSRNEN